MWKSRLLSTACAAALTVGVAGAALASEPEDHGERRHWYASLFGGWSSPQDHKFAFVNQVSGSRFPYIAPLDEGFVVGGAVGVILNKNVRLEVELSHSSFDYTNTYRSLFFQGQNPSGSQDVTTLFFNAWFNANFGIVSPYIGGGVGVGWVDADLRVTNGAGQQFDGSDTGFAAQFGTGLRFALGEHWELDVGYRVRHVADVNVGSAIAGFKTTDFDVTTYSVLAGVNFKF